MSLTAILPTSRRSLASVAPSMLSVEHEFCVSLLREDVRLVPELLRRAFGLALGVDDGRAWPELAVLSAIAHGKTAPPEDAAAIGVAALAAAARLDDDRGPVVR
jgi:hypothetical protein